MSALTEDHLREAGARMWNTGRATEEKVTAWCDDNHLTEQQAQCVRDGYAEALLGRLRTGLPKGVKQ